MSSLLTLAGNAAPTGFYDFPIEQSLRFNDDDSAYLSWTPASAGNRRTWTWSGWVKRGGAFTLNQSLFSSATNYDDLRFSTNGELLFVGGTSGCTIATTPLYRDPSAWMSIILSYNSTEATSSDRVKIYVNGEQVTSLTTAIYPALNRELDFNNTVAHAIGRRESTDNLYADLYLADVNFIDGQALDPTSFGELKSGIWIPKDTADLTFGTNGFRLQYGDSAAIGDDTSGNTNDWTVNNLVASDVVLDSPTNNFAVMNPLSKAGSGGITFSEGNLKVAVADNGNARSNFVMNSGKWYWEAMVVGGASFATIGIAEDGYYSGNLFNTASTAKGYIYINDGNKRSSLSGSATAYGASYTTNDIIGVAYDADNGTVTFYKNNTTQGTAYTGLSGGHSAYFQGYGGTATWVLNTGADSTFAGNTTTGGNADANGYGDFKYAVPSGFLSLCSANLPTGAIDTLNDETPEDYFSTILWTGDATNPRTLTAVGFEPSFSWLKSRSQAFSHRLYDAVRGAGNVLFSNATSVESSGDAGGELSAFTSDGFTTSGSSNNNNLNGSGYTYVGWNWKANGSGVSNTDGSITSTVSVGATSQQNWFSIVSYTGNATAGATVGHGLDGTVPDMIITKARGAVSNWFVYHSANTSQPETEYLTLETTNATTDNSTTWNDTAPTSSVFSIGQSGWNNTSGIDYIAYCFANAEGLCKVGSYTGNGSADGTFVYTGHRVAFLLIKRTDTSNDWVLWDAKRDPYNYVGRELQPDKSDAELSYGEDIDFVSNGFKIRRSGTNFNASGGTYIYLSIAEQDFRFANAR